MMNHIFFNNGKIFNPQEGSFEKGDLFIRNNRIFPSAPKMESKNIMNQDLKMFYVIPPLVDFHCHLYYGGSNIAFNPEFLANTGVLYACDGGSAGISNIVGLKNYADRMKDKLNIYFWLNMANTGIHENHLEMQSQSLLDADSFFEISELIKDNLIGITLRLSYSALRDSVKADYVLDLAFELAETLNIPLMVHMSQLCYPIELIIKRMRPMDVVTEIYHDQGEGILNSAGKVRKSFFEARERNVYFDLAHGSRNFSFEVASACIKQGFLPDFLSTNLTHRCYHQSPVYSMLNLISKFLALGVPLEEIIKRVTVIPAKYLGIKEYPSLLNSGDEASLISFQISRGKWIFTDAYNNTICGNQLVEPFFVFRKGNLLYRKENVLL